MDGRTAGGVIGCLAVVCLLLVLSVVFPIATSEPHSAKPPEQWFRVGEAEAYRATGSVVVDGETSLAFEGVVDGDGGWYRRLEEDGLTSETYRAGANETVYERLTIERGGSAERLRDHVVDDEDRELVREDRGRDRLTLVVERNASGAADPVSGAASVIVNSLFVAGYDPVETDPSTVAVYEPRGGWYGESEPYRVTSASGEVRADPETNAVESAHVSWDVTATAGTYAEYVLVRLTGDDPTTHEITYEFDPGDHDVERPAWVDGADVE